MADFTPLTSLVQAGAPGSSAHVVPAGSYDSSGGPGAGVTCLQPVSYKREEASTASTVYVPPNVGGAPGAPPRTTTLYPENTRMGAPGTAIAPPAHPPAAPHNQQPHMQPYQPGAHQQQPQQRVAFGGGHELPPNPRLDPAGEVYTHVPRVPPSSPFGASGFNQRVFLQQQAELAEFQESKRRAALYAQLFQSGLFPFLAGLLFLLFTCAPVHEAVLRILTPFGLVHEAGGGLTLAGQVAQSALFGFVFSFAVYLT